MSEIIARPATIEEPADVGKSRRQDAMFVRGPASAEDEASRDAGPTDPETLAEEMPARVRQQAEEIVAQAHGEAEAIRAEVRASETAAVEEREREAFRQAADQALSELRTAQEALWTEVTEEAAALVAELAGRVVARLVEADDGIVVDVTRRALQDLSDARELHVRVAPEAVEAVTARLEELRGELRPEADVSVIEAEDMAPGGCVVSSELGEVDARIETQLEGCAKAVEESLGLTDGGDSEVPL